MQVPKEEQETIILYNEAEDVASIYSFNRSLLRRLEKYTQKHPDICRKGRQYADGAAEYLLYKKYLSVHFLEPEFWNEDSGARLRSHPFLGGSYERSQRKAAHEGSENARSDQAHASQSAKSLREGQ